MSRAFRKTVAALAFSEAAANIILNSTEADENILKAARLIKKYCHKSHYLLQGTLTDKDLAKLTACTKKVGMLWEDGMNIVGQKMVAWCCFLLNEPVTRTKRQPLQGHLQSIADLLTWINGILEDRDGGMVFEAVKETDDAYQIYRESGWAA